MSLVKLTEYQLKNLRPLELELKLAVHSGNTDKAIELATQIQELFPNEWRKHHRLLRAKLWAFESCLDANRISYAQRGFIGIRKLSASNTRIGSRGQALYLTLLNIMAGIFNEPAI